MRHLMRQGRGKCKAGSRRQRMDDRRNRRDIIALGHPSSVVRLSPHLLRCGAPGARRFRARIPEKFYRCRPGGKRQWPP